MKSDYLIVGAGLYGSVLAERIANDLKKSVTLVDKRPHIGGNCYSEVEPQTGIEIHRYGTHIFHTDSPKAWGYITRFTEFNGYYHQVLTTHKGKVFQMPINLETMNAFYKLNLTPSEAQDLICSEAKKSKIKTPRNFEEAAIMQIGRRLYEAFIKGYTMKQWGMDPKDLSPKIFARLPIRFNYNESYFKNGRWQGIPLNGYTKVFERMLDSRRIKVVTNCDYFKHKDEFQFRKKLIYTGPIDKFFDYKFGKLNWRTIKLKKKILNTGDFQGTSVMNFADYNVPYTRIHEPRHLHAERSYRPDKTVIFYETSHNGSKEPFYPINNDRNAQLYAQYRTLAGQLKNTIIGGRLGDYAYYDMDKTILAALKCYEEKIISP